MRHRQRPPCPCRVVPLGHRLTKRRGMLNHELRSPRGDFALNLTEALVKNDTTNVNPGASLHQTALKSVIWFRTVYASLATHCMGGAGEPRSRSLQLRTVLVESTCTYPACGSQDHAGGTTSLQAHLAG